MSETERNSKIVQDVRKGLVQLRRTLEGVTWKDRVEPVIGTFTTCLIALASINEELIKHEIKSDDELRGRSLRFSSRGVGLDICPGCYVCGATVRHEGANDYLNNISAYVSSVQDGEEIVSWFKRGGARLDVRPREPGYLQVKIGACDAHVDNLQRLSNATSFYNVIRELDIQETYI